MVRGIEKFREYFKEYTGQYVFIGGTACDLILGRKQVPFRQTKDLDIVLIMEALSEDFVNQFEKFISQADYTHIHKGTGQNQFYRFDKPQNPQFPYMIELFSRRPDYLASLDARLAPIHISDDVLSLSAILLDENYYPLLQRGAVQVDGLSVLDLEYLILFKIKAWLDLSERKQLGEQIDSKTVKKHRNDIIRLAVNIEPETKISLNHRIMADIQTFIDKNQSDNFDLKTIGIKGISLAEVFSKIRTSYQLQT